jgi:hypothetical protein
MRVREWLPPLRPLSHLQQCVLSTLCLVAFYLMLAVMATFILSGARLHTFLAVFAVMALSLVAAVGWLAPDTDHERIRAALGCNLDAVVRRALAHGLTDGECPPASSDGQLFAVRVLVASRPVQRHIPARLSWAIQVALVLLGGLIGAPFAEAWAPSDHKWASILIIAAFSVVFITAFWRLDYKISEQKNERMRQFAEMAKKDVDVLFANYLPLYSPSFRRKFEADIKNACELARADLRCMGACEARRYFDGRRQEGGWEPTALSDFSFMQGMFAAGFIISALLA